MSDTGLNERRMHMLAVFVEKREFTSWLRQSMGEITALSVIGPCFSRGGNLRLSYVDRAFILLHHRTPFIPFLPIDLV